MARPVALHHLGGEAWSAFGWLVLRSSLRLRYCGRKTASGRAASLLPTSSTPAPRRSGRRRRKAERLREQHCLCPWKSERFDSEWFTRRRGGHEYPSARFRRASDAREKGTCHRNCRERSQSRRLGGAVNTGPLSFVVRRMERYRKALTARPAILSR